jgi:hypothetical protein
VQDEEGEPRFSAADVHEGLMLLLMRSEKPQARLQKQVCQVIDEIERNGRFEMREWAGATDAE